MLRPPACPRESSMPHDLNPAQKDAVQTLSGPLLVLAGAGTGKTRVVTYRISELVKHGVAPERILAVTFTNKAAAEMQQRTAALLKKRRKERPEISTFHSLCARILRRQIHHLGYPAKFAIYDRGDQESVARAALREIKVPGQALRPGDLIQMIGRWKSSSIRPRQASALAETDKEHLAAAAYRRYQNNLKTTGAVDFDDLLLLVEDLFRKFPAVRREESGRFDQLLIDEYQDTNGSQYRIVKTLAAGHRNLCVVGDDDQSIYGWRGAEVEHILRFRRDWPEAKVVRLEENYRSTAAILTMANHLITFNKNRHKKVLRAARRGGQIPRILQFKDESEEAAGIVGDIRQRLTAPGAQPRDFAILFRTNEQPRAFELELRAAKLPYVLIGGMSFYDRKEVRDVLAYLKLVVNPHDEISLLRVINTPPRGIGQSTVARMMKQATSGGKSLWDVLSAAPQSGNLSPAATAGIGKFCGVIRQFHQQRERGSLADLANRLIGEVGYRDELVRLYADPNERQTRLASVEEVVNALASYEHGRRRPTLKNFLDDAALGGRDDLDEKESQLDRNAIALMTLHSAKGLEFPNVTLVGMEEGILPHHRSVAADGSAIEEERRLCYVGVTRAQDRLTLSLSLTRRKWGKSRPTQPSRFLFELTGQADRPHATPRSAHRPKSVRTRVGNRRR